MVDKFKVYKEAGRVWNWGDDPHTPNKVKENDAIFGTDALHRIIDNNLVDLEWLKNRTNLEEKVLADFVEIITPEEYFKRTGLVYSPFAKPERLILISYCNYYMSGDKIRYYDGWLLDEGDHPIMEEYFRWLKEVLCF